MNPLLYCLPLLVALPVTAAPAGISFQSAAEQTPLLELYTSEGCSSCPPAETWLGHLKDSPGLWRDFVPVAFHVDYWDYLGWRDPWAKRSYSDRQRAYAESWRSDNVYTPGLVLNGREWRDWPAGRKEDLKPSEAKTGVLTVSSSDTNHWQVSFALENPGGANLEVHAALLASGLSSDVKAGENRDRRLTHDSVVMSIVAAPLTRGGDIARGEFVLEARLNDAVGSTARAGWITQPGHLEPLQATGGWLLQAVPVRSSSTSWSNPRRISVRFPFIRRRTGI